MGMVLSIIGYCVITSLINDTNILVIYLSLVVLFFLLGLVLGLNIRTRKKNPKEEKSPDINDTMNKSKQTFVPGPDSRESKQIVNANQNNHHSRHRHHRHSSIHIQ